jgi:ornithine decarboxylase
MTDMEGCNMIDCGGGFPVQYDGDSIPPLDVFTAHIKESAYKLAVDRQITLVSEPGRGICGDAVTLCSDVVLKTERNGATWLHLDAGVYSGLEETRYGIRYKVSVAKAEKHHGSSMHKYVLVGPTCDCVDVLYSDVVLPSTVDVGDTLIFENVGAYSNVLASSFNGFDVPSIVFLEDNC